jgi:hypothetical protein
LDVTNVVDQGVGNVGNAATFVIAGVDDILIKIGPTGLPVTDVDFTVGCWVNFLTLGTNGFFGTGLDGQSAASSHNWFLFYNGDFRMVGCAGSSYKQAVETTIGAASINTWYFVVGEYNATTDTLGIMVNDNTMNTLGSVTALNTVNRPMMVGGRISGGAFLNGRTDEGFVVGRLLNAEEKSWLYNSGAGRSYSEL